MSATSAIDTLTEIYATKGYEVFELDRIVSHTSHGLQAAKIAEEEGASATMIVAALFHDIGRIINPKDREITEAGGDAKHEEVARAYHTYRYPETLLVDRNGIVVERFVGPKDWDASPYVARIQRLLREDAG